MHDLWRYLNWRGEISGLFNLLDYRYFTVLLAGGPSDHQYLIQLLQSLIEQPLQLKVYYFPES